jgi:hypothetical protein
MNQFTLFDIKDTSNNKYSKKITTPVYEPKNQKPHLLSLFDDSKTHRLIREILSSDVPIEEKEFLIAAARRHTVFNYEQIADYYAHSSSEMQQLMERSALVIIDFNDAIQYGYINLCDQIKTQYLSEYQENKVDEQSNTLTIDRETSIEIDWDKPIENNQETIEDDSQP